LFVESEVQKLMRSKRKEKERELQLIPSIQVPPFKHRFGEQSLILVWHFVPSKPVPAQSHEKVSSSLEQIPSFWHGFGEQ